MGTDRVLTFKDLQQMQNHTFERKINISITRIMEFLIRTKGNISVSFSGGADSIVLLDLVCKCWNLYSINEPLHVNFVDTSNEYKGMLKHVRESIKWAENFHGINIILDEVKAKKSFIEVIKEKGYPAVSKKTSKMVRIIREDLKRLNVIYKDIENTVDEGIESANYLRDIGFQNQVILYLTGITTNNSYMNGWHLANKWRKLIIAPFDISEECCTILKKEPIARAEKLGNREGVFVGTLAADSTLRRDGYLKTGCNSFSEGKNRSIPLGFWLRQDILHYIDYYNLPIAPPYGKLICKNCVYRFTKEQHTGCKLCLFGVHMEKGKNRIQRLEEYEPSTYNWALKPLEQGGLNYAEVMEYLELPYKNKKFHVLF